MPERLVFIDETGASTKMARRYGRAPRGQRCQAAIPHGHWKTTTFIGALRSDGITAPMVLDGAMHGDAVLAYVEQMLVPTLKPGDIVTPFPATLQSRLQPHPTVQTSTPSRWPSQSSRPF